MIDLSQQTYQNILTQMLDQVPATFDKRDTSPIPTALGPAATRWREFLLTPTRGSSRPTSRRPPGRRPATSPA